MLLPVLVAAFLLPAEVASMPCANLAATQTQPVRGRDGMAALLKVSSADDHSKNSHDCEAQYQLVITPTTGPAVVVALLTSDAGWDRSLSLRLNGFSHDGQRVFGVLSEDGKFSSTTLFDYNTADGTVRLIDLKERFAHIVAAKCVATSNIIGSTTTSAIVLELHPAEPCATGGRWLLNPAGSPVQRLPQHVSFLNLYEFKDDAP
jgi:hypothetical protein